MRGDERVIRSCGWIEDEKDRSASPQQQPPASWWWSSSPSPSWPWSWSSLPGIATQQSWRSTTLMCALARASSATAPPRKSLIEKHGQLINFYIAGSPSLWSPSCPPWPLATWYTRSSHLSIHRRTEEPQSGGRRQISANTQKLFPEKNSLWPPEKKLVDLRDAAFKLLFEVVQKPSGGCLPSPSNCYQPNAWVLVVQLGCET